MILNFYIYLISRISKTRVSVAHLLLKAAGLLRIPTRSHWRNWRSIGDSYVQQWTSYGWSYDKDIFFYFRPVTCPLTVCRKMIARDFILQHFYFDHSKIPRITLNTQPQRNFLNASLFTENTSCYAVLLLTTEQMWYVNVYNY